jgi:hypothetical protein
MFDTSVETFFGKNGGCVQASNPGPSTDAATYCSILDASKTRTSGSDVQLCPSGRKVFRKIRYHQSWVPGVRKLHLDIVQVQS